MSGVTGACPPDQLVCLVIIAEATLGQVAPQDIEFSREGDHVVS